MVKRSIEQEIRNRNFGTRSGKFEKNAVVKHQGTKQRVERILGDRGAKGNQRAMCEKKETISISTTTWISVGKVHHQIRLRILSCNWMNENHRGPEVPEVKVPAGECRDGLARITLEELAITHFVKNGTLQNACTRKPKVVANLVWNAHSHTVELMNNRRKGPHRKMTKVLWLCWKREIGKRHQDPGKIDLHVPRRAQYLHNARKKQKDAVFWVDIDIVITKGLMFYQRIGQENWFESWSTTRRWKLLDNQEEKLLVKLNSSNQPNQFQIQFVIDQGNLVSRKTW